MTVSRPKECRHCGASFYPVRPMQRVCSVICASRLVKEAKKQERESVKVRKEAIKTRADWAREAQTIVNKYVRLRDAHLGCVSCDKPANWHGQWHASHFRSVGAATAVRFNIWNIHKACSVCNSHLSGNLGSYLPRLIEKIGKEKVDWLYAQNQLVRYDVQYLQRLKSVFSKKVRRLERKLK